MKQEFQTRWQGGMAFETDLFGHALIVDAPEDSGGADRGPRPKPLLVAALTGCTGMDVMAILRKMQVTVDALEMRVEVESTEEHPRTYVRLHLIYAFTGREGDRANIEKAVRLSQERYCGVSALLRKGLDLTYEVTLTEK